MILVHVPFNGTAINPAWIVSVSPVALCPNLNEPGYYFVTVMNTGAIFQSILRASPEEMSGAEQTINKQRDDFLERLFLA